MSTQEHSSPEGSDNELVDSGEMDDLNEEQSKWPAPGADPLRAVIATIVELGNQIWLNMGFEEPIEDVSVFFR